MIFFMSKTENGKKIKAVDIVSVAMMTALIVICSWVYIPIGNIPVTLQTFAVCVAVGIFGMKKGTLSVAVYLILGILGLPVFSFFKGGIGALFGATGGYTIGFVLCAFVSGFIISKSKKIPVMIMGFAIGLIVCYAVGTLWFLFVYMKDTGAQGLVTALTACVFPFVIPDIIKIVLAAVVADSVRKKVKL